MRAIIARILLLVAAVFSLGMGTFRVSAFLPQPMPSSVHPIARVELN